MHKAKIARELGVGWSTVQHHARALVGEGKLREIEYRGLRFLVRPDIPAKRAVRVVVLGVPEHKKALWAVAKGRGERIQDVARVLRWSRKTARRSLYALVGVGLLEKSDDYHPRFMATTAGRAELRRSA
ncbi:MAG TPA: hypothetical protein VGB18_04130 [Candidatus Thermoplasmatota archaeon]